MGDVIIKPLTRVDSPDGPIYATEVDGLIVHGGQVMSSEGKEFMSRVIAAARLHLAKLKPIE